MDHVILNHGQVTWTTPELAPPLLTTTPHQREDVSALDRFNKKNNSTRPLNSKIKANAGEKQLNSSVGTKQLNSTGENNSTRQHERNNSTGENNSTRQQERTTQLDRRNETTQLCTAVDRLQSLATAYNRLYSRIGFFYLLTLKGEGYFRFKLKEKR
ncbi:hypothetical protein TNCV_1148781 [Trichonephila clavipes]|nr:hypothetical protein TNCV_1148781 [Trichonephila clavipes]